MSPDDAKMPWLIAAGNPRLVSLTRTAQFNPVRYSVLNFGFDPLSITIISYEPSGVLLRIDSIQLSVIS
jgi:hypothetical protein